MLNSVGFERVVTYPVKRFARARLARLPMRAKMNADLTSTAPRSSRPRLVKDFLRAHSPKIAWWHMPGDRCKRRCP